MSVENINLRRATETGELPKNGFVITSKGNVKILDSKDQWIWQKFSEYRIVRKYYGVDNAKLETYMQKKAEESNNNPNISDNIEFLEDIGTFERSQNKAELQKKVSSMFDHVQKMK
jgi:hypothetical protein